MMDAALDEALAKLFAANGLKAKRAVLTRHAALLLTTAAEARLSEGKLGQSGAADGPEIHAGLIALCREQGPDTGSATFALILVNLWLDQPTLKAKVPLLAAWSDPLLSGFIRDELVAAAERMDDSSKAAALHWHARLVARCRDKGLEAGLAEHRAMDGDQPRSPAADVPLPSDPGALFDELSALAGENRDENRQRMTVILEALLALLPTSGGSETEKLRAGLDFQLASILSKMIDIGLLRQHWRHPPLNTALMHSSMRL